MEASKLDQHHQYVYVEASLTDKEYSYLLFALSVGQTMAMCFIRVLSGTRTGRVVVHIVVGIRKVGGAGGLRHWLKRFEISQKSIRLSSFDFRRFYGLN